MTEWSKHVHRFAKKHNMTYKQANVSRKCKEAYKKRKTSPRRKSPRRKTSPRKSPRRKNRSNRTRLNGGGPAGLTPQEEKMIQQMSKDNEAKRKAAEDEAEMRMLQEMQRLGMSAEQMRLSKESIRDSERVRELDDLYGFFDK